MIAQECVRRPILVWHVKKMMLSLGGSFNGHVELGRSWAGSSKVTFACLAIAVHHICNRCDTTHDPAGDHIFLTWHLWRRPKICMLKLAFLRFHANQR